MGSFASLRQVARDDRRFVTSSATKRERERWVLDQWILATGQSPTLIEIGDDPPDWVVDGLEIEIAEVLRPGRRRGDEYRWREGDAEAGRAPARFGAGTLSTIRDEAHRWITDQIRRKSERYDRATSSRLTLLLYVNLPWTDHIQWSAVVDGLVEYGPPFRAIEVVFHDASGARTISIA